MFENISKELLEKAMGAGRSESVRRRPAEHLRRRGGRSPLPDLYAEVSKVVCLR